ncbi:MAG: response regulator [Tannerellaceae bacterium]|nr:response regulator [Tannerellaceae bacterium]
MKQIWLILLSYLPVCTCLAQLNCSFSHYASEDGLSQNTVMSILEDSKGYMWFATWDGINKFDGYTFRTYKPNDDNSVNFTNNRVDHIYEDAFGYIWVLSYDNRAHRFDPRTERFTQVPASGEESRFYIRSIKTLPEGAVWLLTAGEGALRVAARPEPDITPFSIQSGRIQAHQVYDVFPDEQKNEWLLTGNGLYKYMPGTSSVTSFFADSSGHSFYSFLEQSQAIWFGSGQGRIWKYNKKEDFFELKEFAVRSDITSIQPLSGDLLVISTRVDGFFTYHTKTGMIRYYNQDNSRLPGNRILSAYFDREKEVWFDIADVPGVTHFNTVTGEIIHERVDTEKGTADRSDPNFHIHEDVNGFLWVHPFGGGFSRYDRSSRRLTSFHNQPGAADWRFSNKIHSAFSDRTGNLWMCTHSKGLEKITFFPEMFRLTTPEQLSYESLTNDIRCIYEDHRKRLWVGAKDGKIRLYSPEGNYLGYLSADGTISRTAPQAAGVAYHIMQDRDGIFWISTKGEGIIKITETGDRFRMDYFRHDPENLYSLSDNNVYYSHAAPDGRIWVATFGGGLNYIHTTEEGETRFISFRNELTGWPIEHCYRVRVVTSDQEGTIWAGTTSGAVSFRSDFKDPGTIEFHHHYCDKANPFSISDNDIYSIRCTRKGEVFLATFGGGLNKAERTENGRVNFRHYTVRNGLSSNVLLSLEEDSRGHLWISTESGLCRFDPVAGHAEVYDDNHFNYHTTFNEASSTARPDGRIVFGTMKGMISFQPDSIRKSDFVPPVVFTGFLLANEKIQPGSHPALEVIPDEAVQLRLSPKEKIFTLQYAALDMKAPEKIQYAYRLEGFEKEWNYIDKQRSVTYTNLPKGEYLFRVRSTNSDGVWVDNVREMKLVILPTFWETPWGILLYVLFIIAVILTTVVILFTIYRLKHKVRMEQQISDIKLRFFTNISHELRTPLTLIAGPVEHVLTHETLTPEAREQLQLVERNTNRMLRLINQILDFRKIQNKKMKLKVQPLDMVLFVRRVMDNFEALAEEHRIDFILESEAKSVTLWLDMDKLEKIVFNLVSNAFKYTPPDKMIRVAIRENEEHVLLSVEDQGIGIAENRRESIFERFENLMDKNVFDQSSTGIGLSLVKELVDMHQATIRVDSRLGEGSTFTVTFRKGKEHYTPETEFILQDQYTEATATLKPESEFIPTTAMGETSETEPENIGKDLMLIVEDNVELRSFLTAIFRSSFRLAEAVDGTEGWQKAQQLLPDIIISDVMMPGINGIDLVANIREHLSTSHIPIVLLTAKSTIESKLKGLEYGADDYITKPFSSTYLQARVSNLLNQRKTLQTLYRTGTMIEYTEPIPAEESVKDMSRTDISPNDRKFMDKLFILMETNMDNGDLIVDDLVKEMAVSRSVFFKKLKALTGLAPVEFIKEIRIKRAASLIEENEYTMTQISYMVGINDSRYFSKCFKQVYGMTPTEYKEQYLQASGQKLHK